jgi:deoxyribose-phosphate aldolase
MNLSASAENDLPCHLEAALFAPDASRVDVEKLCADAREQNLFAVCVNGSRVELARALTEESNVQVVALIGFPFGASDSDAKRYEAEIAVDHGAHELDLVINLGRLKDGDTRYVLRELRDIVEAADERPVKAVLETSMLTREETILGCQLVLDSGAQFIVTSTDFHTPAVSVETVKLLRETLGTEFGLKAAGGIRDLQAAQALLAAGATRLGIRAGALILPASGFTG